MHYYLSPEDLHTLTAIQRNTRPGRRPSITELARHLRISHTDTYIALDALEDTGAITRLPRAHRTITVQPGTAIVFYE